MRHLAILCALALGIASASTAQTSQVVLAASLDNTLYEESTGAVSNAKGQYFFVGRTFQGKRDRACIAFTLAGAVPKGSTIVSVKLTLEMDKTIAGAVPIGMHRLNASWGEGTSAAIGNEGGGAASTTGDATWVHRFWSTTNWTNAGGDFQATASATQSVAGAGSYAWGSTTALVADVQGWLDAPASNFGWLLLGDETATSAKRFASREHLTATVRPALTIDYTPPPATVTPVGTGCAGSNPLPFLHGASGLPTVPNPAFAWTVRQGPATIITVNAWCALMLPAPLPITPRCNLYVDPTALVYTQPALTDAQGSATYPLPVPNVARLIGVQLATQILGFDKGAPAGLITSNGLLTRLGK